MPEAHRLLGFILMQLGAPRRARDEYAKAANLGDDEAVLDMLRASYEAETPDGLCKPDPAPRRRNSMRSRRLRESFCSCRLGLLSIRA